MAACALLAAPIVVHQRPLSSGGLAALLAAGQAVQRLRAHEVCLSAEGRGHRGAAKDLGTFTAPVGGLIIPRRVKATPSNAVRRLMVW